MKRLALLVIAAYGNAHAVDLIDIYRDALSQDPVYSDARYTYEANKELLPQARAGLLPSV